MRGPSSTARRERCGRSSTGKCDPGKSVVTSANGGSSCKIAMGAALFVDTGSPSFYPPKMADRLERRPRSGDSAAEVLGTMMARMLGPEVKLPVGVQVPAGSKGAKLKYRLGTAQRPAGAGFIHPVADQVAAGALHDAGRDGKALRECIGVVQEVAVLAQIGCAGVDGVAPLELLKCRASGHSGR